MLNAFIDHKLLKNQFDNCVNSDSKVERINLDRIFTHIKNISKNFNIVHDHTEKFEESNLCKVINKILDNKYRKRDPSQTEFYENFFNLDPIRKGETNFTSVPLSEKSKKIFDEIEKISEQDDKVFSSQDLDDFIINSKINECFMMDFPPSQYIHNELDFAFIDDPSKNYISEELSNQTITRGKRIFDDEASKFLEFWFKDLQTITIGDIYFMGSNEKYNDSKLFKREVNRTRNTLKNLKIFILKIIELSSVDTLELIILVDKMHLDENQGNDFISKFDIKDGEFINETEKVINEIQLNLITDLIEKKRIERIAEKEKEFKELIKNFSNEINKYAAEYKKKIIVRFAFRIESEKHNRQMWIKDSCGKNWIFSTGAPFQNYIIGTYEKSIELERKEFRTKSKNFSQYFYPLSPKNLKKICITIESNPK